MSSKEYVRVGEEITLNYGRGLPARDRKPGPYKVVGSSDIVDSHEEFAVHGPGIVIGRKGSVGALTWLEEDFWPIDTTYYVSLNHEGDLKYWYYQLHNLKLNTLNSHAAVPGLNRDDVYRIEVIKRSAGEQKKIAKILSDLDRKIELNRRMNETLEQIGQTLFKKYFIDNPESKKWKEISIGDIANVVLGGTPSRSNSDYWGGNDIGWINSGEVNKFRITTPSEYITRAGLENSAAKLLPEGTIVLAITGATLGQVSRLEKSFAANQSVVGVYSEDRNINNFLYFWITTNILSIIRHATGGAQQHINRGDVEQTTLKLPPRENLELISCQLELIMSLTKQNTLSIDTLTIIRDDLLPKLISGSIKV